MIYPKIGTPQKGHLRPKHNDKTKHDKTNHRILGVPCHAVYTVISYPFISYFSTHPLPLKLGPRHDSKADATLAPYCIIYWCPLADLGWSWQILAAWNVGMLRGWNVFSDVFRVHSKETLRRCYCVKAMKFIFKPLNCVGPWCKKKTLRFAQQSSTV